MPLFETAKRFTDESVLMVVKAERIFLNSHTFTVRSSEPEITLSSRVNTVDVTLLQNADNGNITIIGIYRYKAIVIWYVLSVSLEDRHTGNRISKVP